MWGIKAESYQTGKGDPVIRVDSLNRGAVLIHDGNANTNSPRNAVMRITQGTATLRTRYTLEGVDASINTNVVDDQWLGELVKVTETDTRRATVIGNMPIRLLGNASIVTGGRPAKASGYQSGTTYIPTLEDAFRATVQIDHATGWAAP